MLGAYLNRVKDERQQKNESKRDTFWYRDFYLFIGVMDRKVVGFLGALWFPPTGNVEWVVSMGREFRYSNHRKLCQLS